MRHRTSACLALDLANLEPEIQQVSQLWRGERNPVTLYKIFEIVRHSARENGDDLDDFVGGRQRRRFYSQRQPSSGVGG